MPTISELIKKTTGSTPEEMAQAAKTLEYLYGTTPMGQQDFGPGDSTIASSVAHPIKGVGKLANWLKDNVNTAAGYSDPYDNPNPLLGPSMEQKALAGVNLAGLLQTGAMPFAPKSTGGTLGSITAWHGSPHKFDKFDMRKIGTGEGAQAYGHGLYFAENPEVATGYKNKLSSTDLLHEVGGKRYFRSKGRWLDNDHQGVKADPDTDLALDLVHYFSKDKDEAIKQALASIDNEKLYSKRNFIDTEDIHIGQHFYTENEILRAVDVLKNKYQGMVPEGNLYKTSLEWPDAAREASDPMGPHHFLDWDKPLSEQHESIIKALKSSGRWADDEWKYGKPINEVTGADVAKSVNSRNNEGIAWMLQKEGIPGVRYLDGGSRGVGEGSYNYVLFDDKIPKIVERNGMKLKDMK
ncbi:MAG: hypothetical protein WC449_05625 [Candidatus Paceibacterota bacterium]